MAENSVAAFAKTRGEVQATRTLASAATMKSMKKFTALVAFCLCACVARAESQPPLIRLLIVDGQNNHDWQATTPYLRRILEASDRFSIEVATAPPSPSTPEGQERYTSSPDQYAKDLQAFRPEFDRFDVILLNYNGAWAIASS